MQPSTQRSTRVARRAVLTGLVAGAGAVAGLGEGRRETVGMTGPERRGVAESDLLVDSVGVNVHLSWRSTGYELHGQVLEVLEDLGIRHVRDRIIVSSTMREAFARLGRHGIRVQGVCGALGDPQSMAALMTEVRAGHPRPTAVFTAFEGINEPNNDGVPWVDETRAKTRELVAARDRARLSRIPVVAPGLARVNEGGVEGSTTAQQSVGLGDLRDAIDFGNVHVYPRQQTPSADIDRFVREQRPVSGRLPVICSEAGYFTAMSYQGGAWPTPEDVVATYLPRLVLEHWIRGTHRVFLYELLDRYDPSNADRLSSFGLVGVPSPDLRAAWRQKPAYDALRNLLGIMADAGPAHTPTKLDVSVDGGGDVRTARFAKRDGSHYLALWRDVSCYDPATRTRLPVPDTKAVVRFGRRCDVSAFRPSASVGAVTDAQSSSSTTLALGSDLVIVRARPTG